MRAPLLVLVALAACWEEDVTVTWPAAPPSDTGDDTGDDTADASPSEEVVLVDANNYVYAAAMDLPTVVTAEGGDLSITWTALTEDLACNTLDPATDITTLSVYAFSELGPSEVEAALLDDALTQADLHGFGSAGTGGATTATLANVSMFGLGEVLPVDYVEGNATWMLGLSDGDDPFTLVRALTFIEPRAASSNTDVAFADPCGTLTYTASLDALTPAAVRTEGAWHLDWSGLTTAGDGDPLSLGTIDRVTLGWYEDLTPADLADPLLELDERATTLWTWSVADTTTLDLATAPDRGIAPTEMVAEGTWLLALRCSTCTDRAPVFLTVLAPS